MLPYVTEEVWSWWQDGSVHRAAWPTAAELVDGGDPRTLTDAGAVLGAIRKAKSDAKVGMRAEVTSATVTGPLEALARVKTCADDLRAAGRVATLEYAEGETVTVRDALLAPPAS